MSKPMNFEDLKNIDFDENLEIENNEPQIVRDRSQYKNYSKSISLTVGYMLGVEENFLKMILEDEEEYEKLKNGWLENGAATIINHLNHLRSLIILNFKYVSRRTRITASDYTPIYLLDILKDDFSALKKSGIDFITGKNDLNEYLSLINNEIKKHIDKTKSLFPEWVNFKHIVNAFIMPPNIEDEAKKFQINQSFYPYQRYFNWRLPYDNGNIILSDNKLLEVLYESDHDKFIERSKVVDASETVKDNINEFLEYGTKIQIFVDGENTNPFALSAAIMSFTDEEIDKINKIIVYYDEKYSSKAWIMLQHFVQGVETEAIPVVRLKEEKSLVDHKLVAGVSKAVYQDDVDSVILCSSDSDFWSVIQDVKAKYLVMAESDKCGSDFKDVLRENNIFYCFLDRFKTPADNPFKKMVLRRVYQEKLNAALSEADINIKGMYEDTLRESYLELSEQEIKNTFDDVLKNFIMSLDENGRLKIEIKK